MNCPICSGAFAPFARAVVLGRHNVRYFRCARCGLIQTEKPYWLADAYARPINAADIGAVDRAFRMSRTVRALILARFDGRGRFLDYGAGYGLFVRRMRDLGFDFRYYDKHDSNLFARGFAADADAGRYELVTALEVFEHFDAPLAAVETLSRLSDNIFFTTALAAIDPPRPDQWSYYGLEHGQHVTLYTRAALEALARRGGFHLHSDGRLVHLLTRKPLSQVLFRALLRPGVQALAGPLLARARGVHSLLVEDAGRVGATP